MMYRIRLIVSSLLYFLGWNNNNSYTTCYAWIQQQQRLSLLSSSSSLIILPLSRKQPQNLLSIRRTTAATTVPSLQLYNTWIRPQLQEQQRTSSTRISVSSSLSASLSSSSSSSTDYYSDEEIQIIKELAVKFQSVTGTDSDNTVLLLESIVLQSVATLSPTLLLKLRQPPPTSSTGHDDDDVINYVQTTIASVVSNQFDVAKETLVNFLNAGELRKLDNLITKAAKDGKLNVPFFQVLQTNIQDAAQNDNKNNNKVDDNKDDVDTDPTKAASVDRISILKHIYTRCQEEVEKLIPPGTALLNKLLRTEQRAIRTNLFQHYLVTPDSGTGKVLTTPDGKSITLQPVQNGQSLITVTDFGRAIGDAVQQVRTIEQSNIISRESAAQMMEACRVIAKEARTVLIERYGGTSTEVLNFQQQLTPVFTNNNNNPTTTSSTTTTK